MELYRQEGTTVPQRKTLRHLRPRTTERQRPIPLVDRPQRQIGGRDDEGVSLPATFRPAQFVRPEPNRLLPAIHVDAPYLIESEDVDDLAGIQDLQARC